MLSHRFELFSILGFRVSLDLSWVFLAVLVTWSLATGWFPQAVPGIDPAAAWWLGALGALGLFASIILHELSHSLVARRFGIPIRGITLFIFGGVAEMEEEPPSARSEFLMAIAGPAMSYALAALFHAFAALAPQSLAAALFSYLALINAVLATFNLIPAFPLDGGRVFRAAMWGWTGDYARATRTGVALGRLFGIFLIAYGLLSLVTGNTVTGIWMALLGFFISSASRASEVQLSLKTGLAGATAGQIMTRDLIVIPAATPLATAIEDYFHHHPHKAYPVLDGPRLLGCLRASDIGRIPPAERHRTLAGDIVAPDAVATAIAPGTPLLDALQLMQRHGTSRLLTVDNGQLAGILTMRDILTFLENRNALDPVG